MRGAAEPLHGTPPAQPLPTGMGRPRGEVRMALAMAAALCPAGATWRDLAATARVGTQQARRTCEDMRRAGELQVVGQARRPGTRRAPNLYAPTAALTAQGTPATADELQQLLQLWCTVD